VNCNVNLLQGYGKAVDWWTVGILLFEMVAGDPPFASTEHLSIYQKIVAGKVGGVHLYSTIMNIHYLVLHSKPSTI